MCSKDERLVLTVHLGHSGKVLDTGGNVLLVGLFGQVDHVGTVAVSVNGPCHGIKLLTRTRGHRAP